MYGVVGEFCWTHKHNWQIVGWNNYGDEINKWKQRLEDRNWEIIVGIKWCLYISIKVSRFAHSSALFPIWAESISVSYMGQNYDQTLLPENSSHRGSPVQSQGAISKLMRGWPLDFELAVTVNVWEKIGKNTEAMRWNIYLWDMDLK